MWPILYLPSCLGTNNETTDNTNTTYSTDTDTDLDCAFASDMTWYFRDADGDGYGNPDNYILHCEEIDDYTALNDEDCDDSDPDVNPDAIEICYDDKDNDCSNSTDSNCTYTYLGCDGFLDMSLDDAAWDTTYEIYICADTTFYETDIYIPSNTDLTITAEDNVAIDGEPGGDGIEIGENCEIAINNIEFRDFSGGSYAPIIVGERSTLNFTNSWIHNTGDFRISSGIYVKKDATLYAYNSVIEDTCCEGAINVEDGYVELRDTEIRDNGTYGLMWAFGSGYYADLDGVRISGHEYGVGMRYVSDQVYTLDATSDTIFSDNTHDISIFLDLNYSFGSSHGDIHCETYTEFTDGEYGYCKED